MIRLISAILGCLITFAASAWADVTLGGNRLHLVLDDTGRLTALSSPGGANFLDASRSSFLLMVQPYGAGRQPLQPVSLHSATVGQGRTRLTFSYAGGFTATVEATENEKYLCLELIVAKPLAEIARITWGPINTTMKDPLAEYLGLVREGGFTVGMLSLEPNTDGIEVDGGHYHVAGYNGADGSRLKAESWDHTHDGIGQDGYLAQAIPGITVQGSAIALFGCARDEELDVVEAVERGEKLPHPTTNGVWNKRSNWHIAPQLWVHYNRTNLDDYLQLAKLFESPTICNPYDIFGNWGHFTPNPDLYPDGLASLRDVVRRCKAAGIGHAMYTLSTFLLKWNVDEPFITPEFNAGFQYLPPVGALAEPVGETNGRIVLKDEPGLVQTLNKVNFVRVDGELIARDKVEEVGGEIVMDGSRGALGTRKTAHQAGTKAFCILQDYMDSFCPGTIELQDAVADNMASVARECEFPQVVLDGYESCLRTGHGAYAKNRFVTRLFDKVGNPELRLTAANFGNYDWHLMSYMSWGENDTEKGFRGTMLDYRLRRVLQFKNNHMPGKLGQYYPSDAQSPEDIEWLMGLATGWGAGVDLHWWSLSQEDLKSERLKSFGEIVRCWTDARRAGFFTEQQLLGLRETDRLYHLTREAGWKFKLEFVRRWTHPGLEILPPSVFKIKPVGGSKVESCTTDWSWTHNPGIFRKAGVSDDLVAPANGKESAWDVTYPTDDRLFFVIRVPADAPCAVRNPTVILNGGTRLVIPATLQPGQYLSVPHDTARVGIYDRNHDIIGETYIRCFPGRMPAIDGGKPQRIALSAEAADPKTVPLIRMNLCTRVPIPSGSEGI